MDYAKCLVTLLGMTSFLQKRIGIIVSLIMTVAILAPSMIKLGHALHGHNSEKKCVSYGTNHIHSSDFDCDFHDFTLASKVLFSSQFVYTSVEVPNIVYSSTYLSKVFEFCSGKHSASRAPPMV